jgi:hypothetical protein
LIIPILDYSIFLVKSPQKSTGGTRYAHALVVHKHGDMQPGPGFFELARELGQETPDIVKFWIEEVKRVFATWKTAA